MVDRQYQLLKAERMRQLEEPNAAAKAATLAATTQQRANSEAGDAAVGNVAGGGTGAGANGGPVATTTTASSVSVSPASASSSAGAAAAATDEQAVTASAEQEVNNEPEGKAYQKRSKLAHQRQTYTVSKRNI